MTRCRIKAMPDRNAPGPVFYWSIDADWTTDVADARVYYNISVAMDARVGAGIPDTRHLGISVNYITTLEGLGDRMTRWGIAHTVGDSPDGATISWKKIRDTDLDEVFQTKDDALEANDLYGWRGYVREYVKEPHHS